MSNLTHIPYVISGAVIAPDMPEAKVIDVAGWKSAETTKSNALKGGNYRTLPFSAIPTEQQSRFFVFADANTDSNCFTYDIDFAEDMPSNSPGIGQPIILRTTDSSLRVFVLTIPTTL